MADQRQALWVTCSACRHLLTGIPSRVDSVQFVADLCDRVAVIKSQRAGTGRWQNMLSCGKHIEHAMRPDGVASTSYMVPPELEAANPWAFIPSSVQRAVRKMVQQ